MMTRNTEKRVEVACPIYDSGIKKQLVRYLSIMLADNVKARSMTSDGTYRKKKGGDRQICAQDIFMREAMHAKRPARIDEKKSILDRLRKAVPVKLRK